MAFIGETKLIILDEPTEGLDIRTRNKVWDIIENIRMT